MEKKKPVKLVKPGKPEKGKPVKPVKPVKSSVKRVKPSVKPVKTEVKLDKGNQIIILQEQRDINSNYSEKLKNLVNKIRNQQQVTDNGIRFGWKF